MKNLNHYNLFAQLFEYPGENTYQDNKGLLSIVQEMQPQQFDKIQAVLKTINESSISKQQEYYMKTFDVQAVCYLDIGYLMFGEDYKRAQLLVNLQQEYKRAGIDCGTELGDHLPNILRLIASTRDHEFTEELGFIIIIPAVRFMLTKFKNKTNYYKDVLETLLVFLQNDFKGEGLDDYVISEHVFKTEREFVMTSPKSMICQTECKRKSF